MVIGMIEDRYCVKMSQKSQVFQEEIQGRRNSMGEWSAIPLLEKILRCLSTIEGEDFGLLRVVEMEDQRCKAGV